MEFRVRIKKICRVKYVILFCLILLFLWWGSNAVLKYWSQPLSTDINYKYGETKQGIQFPLITLCMDNGCVIRTKNHETSKVVGFLGMSVGCPDKIHLC